MAELQEVEVNSNCKHLIASINSYVCFLLSHHAHIVVQVLRKPEEKDYGRQKTRFWGIYDQLALFRKQKKDVSFFRRKGSK